MWPGSAVCHGFSRSTTGGKNHSLGGPGAPRVHLPESPFGEPHFKSYLSVSVDRRVRRVRRVRHVRQGHASQPAGSPPCSRTLYWNKPLLSLRKKRKKKKKGMGCNMGGEDSAAEILPQLGPPDAPPQHGAWGRPDTSESEVPAKEQAHRAFRLGRLQRLLHGVPSCESPKPLPRVGVRFTAVSHANVCSSVHSVPSRGCATSTKA